ncbi:hypothetical protein E4T56_gene1818 [Termitomyces sp. T112]|nr:hypothetical protein E4T56_gene1818 [Termitomyces sp. T112]
MPENSFIEEGKEVKARVRVVALRSSTTMSSITRNLPWFIRDLGVSIVGQECYTSLVENLDIGDVKCIKYAVSKGLGIGIVIGGSIMKVPQILLIINARSARGLSLSASILETLSYAITLTYSFRNSFPFTTYGESLFLTLQNALITLLITLYSPPKTLPLPLLTLLLLPLLTLTLALLPHPTLSTLQLLTLPLSLTSKLPQIRQNARARSTGQLSTFAVLSQIAGCAARMFTTAAEVGDWVVMAGFAVGLVLNLGVGVQMWVYWGRGQGQGREREGEGEKGHGEGEGDAAESWKMNQQQQQQRVATPPPRTSSAGGTRKWARKVD